MLPVKALKTKPHLAAHYFINSVNSVNLFCKCCHISDALEIREVAPASNLVPVNL